MGEGVGFPWHLSLIFVVVLFYLNSGLTLLAFTFKRMEVISLYGKDGIFLF